MLDHHILKSICRQFYANEDNLQEILELPDWELKLELVKIAAVLVETYPNLFIPTLTRGEVLQYALNCLNNNEKILILLEIGIHKEWISEYVLTRPYFHPLFNWEGYSIQYHPVLQILNNIMRNENSLDNSLAYRMYLMLIRICHMINWTDHKFIEDILSLLEESGFEDDKLKTDLYNLLEISSKSSTSSNKGGRPLGSQNIDKKVEYDKGARQSARVRAMKPIVN
jgi:hypothetical protein